MTCRARGLFAAPCLALIAWIGASGCSLSCPDPNLANPAKAALATARVVPSEAGAPSTVTTVVVQWAPTQDPLPDGYYTLMAARSMTDGGPGIAGVKLTGHHELTIELRDLDEYLKSSSHLDVQLLLPDQRGTPARCSHPGMSDQFFVTLALDFDTANHTVAAHFGPLSAFRGACDVGGTPGGAGGAGLALVALLAAAAVLARRREGRLLPCARG